MANVLPFLKPTANVAFLRASSLRVDHSPVEARVLPIVNGIDVVSFQRNSSALSLSTRSGISQTKCIPTSTEFGNQEPEPDKQPSFIEKMMSTIKIAANFKIVFLCAINILNAMVRLKAAVMAYKDRSWPWFFVNTAIFILSTEVFVNSLKSKFEEAKADGQTIFDWYTIVKSESKLKGKITVNFKDNKVICDEDGEGEPNPPKQV